MTLQQAEAKILQDRQNIFFLYFSLSILNKNDAEFW